ncbi:MAG: GTPase ObgE [Opitutales bacterium]|nr:GTPase ObgE [Opitutales bacterium]
MFIDETTVSLKAGDGGRGCVAFRREKFEPMGGPNGGDGGKGGDVILRADDDTGDLEAFRYQPLHEAGRGDHGRGSSQIGRGGSDLVLKMPLGTVVFSEETGEKVCELLDDGQEVTLLRGGQGGFGNEHFKSSTNRAPRKFTEGKLGEEGKFRLVLKSIADIGLVGFPNAGKSSLTRVITKARPRTGAYPFTTLIPQLGIIEYPDKHGRLQLADIPGIIAGASQDKGLGHRFLRHIERCQLLALIVDMAGSEGRSPTDDYETLLSELGAYEEGDLLAKPRCLIANKMDLPEANDHLSTFRKKHPIPIFPISCLQNEGLQTLKNGLWNLIKSPTP